MKIYLAGGVTGNLISFWKNSLKLHSEGHDRSYIIDESMKLFLAGIQGKAKTFVLNEESPYILESFFYIRNQHEWIMKMKPYFKDFLLDSGAFTFMQNNKNVVNWEEYTIEYANFIRKHDIKLFFELDIDPIVGLKEVERLRGILENLTGKKCIPVWHKKRGLEYWKQMCKEYDYVAIGGIVTQEIKRTEYAVFLPLLKKLAFISTMKA
jgi:hypothetical protein